MALEYSSTGRTTIFAAALFAALASASCAEDEASSDVVDVVTSATPTVGSAAMASEHEGWKRADCLTCHESAHNDADYTPAQCANCHEENGAPTRPAGHQDEGCATCHQGSHSAEGFESPSDCRACHEYSSPSNGACSAEKEFDVVVIGAGGGGLSAAAYLAKNGMRVAVVEKHYKVGGYMVNFTRGDYRFEASLHAFDGLDPQPYGDDDGSPLGTNIAVFEEMGIWDKVNIVPGDPMYRVIYPQEEHQFNVPADTEEYKELLIEKFPEEAEGIEDLFAQVYAVDEVMRVIFRFQNEGKDIEGEDMQEFFDEINAKGLLDQLLLVQEYMDGTTLSEFLADYVSDKALIAIWTQLAGFLGGSPDEISALMFIAMWNNYHIGGYYYFEGGSQAVSDALAEVVEENGGEIRLNSLVERITIEDSLATGVVTSDGVCLNADYVVSNANARSTLLEMVGSEYLPQDPESPFHPDKIAARNEESLTVGLSIFQVYMGVDHDYSDLFHGAHEVMVTESYDQAENYDSFMQSDVANASYAILNYGIMDPSVAPAGKNVIVVSTILQYDWEEKWHWEESHEAYDAFKLETAMTLVDRVEADYLDGLTQHIEVLEIGTPQTMKGFTLSPEGSIFGWDMVPEQSLNNRLPQQTPIDNLLLAGAWTYPGGGQSAVITSGLFAGQIIMEKSATAE